MKTAIIKNELRKDIVRLLNLAETMFVYNVGEFAKDITEVDIYQDENSLRYILKCNFGSYSRYIELHQSNGNYNQPKLAPNQYFCAVYYQPHIGPSKQTGVIQFSDENIQNELVASIEKYFTISEQERETKAKPTMI